MSEINQMVIQEMKAGFDNLLDAHITDIMKRAKEFTDEDSKFATTFKFNLNSTGKKIVIDFTISYPGAGVKDGLKPSVIDLEQPEFIPTAKKRK